MTTMTPTAATVLAWSALCAFGLGRAAFEDGMRSHAQPPADHRHAVRVPGFDPREFLGRKGIRSLDRATVLALITARELLDRTGPPADPDSTGVVIATSGTLQGMSDFTRGSLLAAKPFHVDPALIPSGLMNHAASQTAIRHRLRGPNVTVAGGRVGALQALAVAARLLHAGRADQVVVGAVEEYSPTRAFVERVDERSPLGEGCALFLLGPPSGGHGTILGIRNQVYDPADPAAGIRGCLLDCLDHCSLTPRDVRTVSLSRPRGPLGLYERDAVVSVLGSRVLAGSPDLAPIGDAASATGAFQLAALLATGPGTSAVVSVDAGGGVACAVLDT
jgi:3-oxoacyl-[acyl-carrier-protein] synthase II